MRPLSWPLKLYVAAIVVAGSLLLYHLTPGLEFPAWWNILFWGIMLLLPEFLSIALPRGGATISVGFAIDYACIIVLGPALTVWLMVIGSLLVDGFIRRAPVHKFTFNTFQCVLTIGLAGLVFELTGGDVGSPNFGLFVFPLVLCAVTYFAVNTATISTAIGLYERISPIRSWTANYKTVALSYLALAPLGLLIALIYLKIGIWGVVLFLIPLFLARFSFKLYADLREEHRQTIAALMSAVDTKDGYFAGHSHRVRDYAAAIARELGLSEAEVETIEYAALLHDVGRVKIKESILYKKTPLTPEEWEIIRSHPEIGARIVAPLTFLKQAAKIVRHHHERPDGLGYPDGLSSAETPLGSQIIKVADAYDAMTHDRPYRRALPKKKAREELTNNQGTQFDSSVVKSLLRLMEKGEI